MQCISSFCKSESKTSEVTDFLRALGLQHLANVFRTEQISMELLLQMNDKDLYDIGIKKGPRFLILKATADVKYGKYIMIIIKI